MSSITRSIVLSVLWLQLAALTALINSVGAEGLITPIHQATIAWAWVLSLNFLTIISLWELLKMPDDDFLPTRDDIRRELNDT